MLCTDWFRLLIRHGMKVHFTRLPVALGVSFLTTFNSKMRIAQLALWGNEIKKTQLVQDPIFILGHWRSGTTLLHELLSVDGRFATPSTYQCFAANHYLLTELLVTNLLWFLLPSRRPMDNMDAGWHAPQEDEFALCSMGLPSPYLRMAFPNGNEHEYLDYLNMHRLAAHDIEEWQDGLRRFLQGLTLHLKKPLILKSPTHTGRIATLAKMFPNAKFVHISRNPYDVVPSTIRLWKSLEYVQALQSPDYEHLPDYVFRAYRCMYDGYFEARDQIDKNRLIEVSYEDLTSDGVDVITRIYERLDLGNFADVRQAVTDNISGRQSYKKNKHSLEPALARQINEHWADYFKNFDYEVRSPTTREVAPTL